MSTLRLGGETTFLQETQAMKTAEALHCEALLSNDSRLQRVTELRVLVVDELEPEEYVLC